MKQFLLLPTACLFFITSVKAQSKTPVKPTAPATVQKEVVLKTESDSASYALGMNIAQSLNQDLGDLNTKLIAQGLQDVFDKKPMKFDEAEIYTILSTYSQKILEEKASVRQKEFFDQNKGIAGLKTTTSGLQYEVIKEGAGAKPAASDSVTVHYRGTLPDGTEFDASYERNEPLTLQLGNVIPGWTEGVQLMSVGSKYKFYIPYELGYGLRGAPPAIPGGSPLIFEIELLDVKKAQ